MEAQTKKVLLLGGSLQSGLYVAKALHKYGAHITVIDWYNLPLQKSKYVDRYIDFGSPKDDECKFSERLINHLRLEKYTAILPVHDPAMEICQKYFNEFSEFSVLLNVNPEHIYTFAHDKRKLLDVAKTVGIRIPAGFYIDRIEQIESKISSLEYPCVVKPAFSAIIKNNRVPELKVSIASSQSELIDYIREYINTVPLIIQEFVPGYGIGYNIIAQNGEVLNAYVHRRLNEHGGVSSYRESLPTTMYGLEAQVTQLVKKMNWSGVAMIEFKIDGDDAYLMEMNGRFWGSIEVAVKSGLNYPVQLYEMQVLKKKISQNIPFRRVGVRNFHNEVFYFGDKLVKGNFIIFFKWLRSLINSFKTNEFIEDNIFDDTRLIFAIYKRDFKRMVGKLFNRFDTIKRKYLRIDGTSRYKILYVCFGNICRSPFAELYSKKHFPGYDFASTGFIPIEERMSPLIAIEVANTFGVDLSKHLSSCLSNEILMETDYFIVMDDLNYRMLLQRNVPEAKIFFLDEKNIDDPYHQDNDVFLTSYKKICSSINNIFEKPFNEKNN